MYTVLFDFITQVEMNDLWEFIYTARYEPGRQGTQYEKAPINVRADDRFRHLAGRSLDALGAPPTIGFDSWIIRYPIGSYIPAHKDDAPFGSSHWRLNAMIQRDKHAKFRIAGREVDLQERDAIVFEPSAHVHEVAEVFTTTRYVFSVGILK